MATTHTPGPMGDTVQPKPVPPPDAAALEAEWLQVQGGRPGVQVNRRTGCWRYTPIKPFAVTPH
jgi:hypothetical protein